MSAERKKLLWISISAVRLRTPRPRGRVLRIDPEEGRGPGSGLDRQQRPAQGPGSPGLPFRPASPALPRTAEEPGRRRDHRLRRQAKPTLERRSTGAAAAPLRRRSERRARLGQASSTASASPTNGTVPGEQPRAPRLPPRLRPPPRSPLPRPRHRRPRPRPPRLPRPRKAQPRPQPSLRAPRRPTSSGSRRPASRAGAEPTSSSRASPRRASPPSSASRTSRARAGTGCGSAPTPSRPRPTAGSRSSRPCPAARRPTSPRPTPPESEAAKPGGSGQALTRCAAPPSD